MNLNKLMIQTTFWLISINIIKIFVFNYQDMKRLLILASICIKNVIFNFTNSLLNDFYANINVSRYITMQKIIFNAELVLPTPYQPICLEYQIIKHRIKKRQKKLVKQLHNSHLIYQVKNYKRNTTRNS